MEHAATDAARKVLAQRLESLARAGVMQLGKAPLPKGEAATPAIKNGPAAARTEPAARAAEQRTSRPAAVSSEREQAMPRAKAQSVLSAASLMRQPYPPPLEAAEGRARQLALINEEVTGCKLCRELAAYRTRTVFGVGNVKPRVVFFGEAPGADEDRQGEPFVGRAGQLLTKIIEACSWKREDVYILNTLKCRPPDNRTPAPDEVANCRPFWERQLEALQPEYIVCAGSVAAQALLETTESVGKMRGKVYNYRGSKVVVTYHPSYLLRNPDAKKSVWDDMQMLLKEMGIPVPKKG